MPASVTQKKIAQRLGISACMVGRALRNDPAYSIETRTRIQEMAQQMGYHSGLNVGARQLAGRRYGRTPHHGVIGLTFTDDYSLGLPYFSHLEMGIKRAARSHGYEVMTIDPTPSLGWSKVDGIIGFGDKCNSDHGDNVAPISWVNLFASREGHSSVLAADDDGIRQATQHLIDLGHTRIGYLCDPDTLTVANRALNYRKTLLANGINWDPAWQWYLHDWGAMEKRGYLSIKTWLEQGFAATGLTALLVQNDRSAIGAMTALKEAGFSVPGRVSVVGFDSTDECVLSSPHLTSVRVPLEDMGTAAVQILLHEINEPSSKEQHIVFPTSLEIRDSTSSHLPA